MVQKYARGFFFSDGTFMFASVSMMISGPGVLNSIPSPVRRAGTNDGASRLPLRMAGFDR